MTGIERISGAWYDVHRSYAFITGLTLNGAMLGILWMCSVEDCERIGWTVHFKMAFVSMDSGSLPIISCPLHSTI